MLAQLKIHFRRGQGYCVFLKMFSILSDDSLPSLTTSVEEALPTLNPAVEDVLLEVLREKFYFFKIFFLEMAMFIHFFPVNIFLKIAKFVHFF